jgi:transposase
MLQRAREGGHMRRVFRWAAAVLIVVAAFAVELMAGTTGVGPRTTEEAGNQVSVYARLVPREHRSGEGDWRGCITRHAPAVLRNLLLQYAWARAVRQRLSRGKPRTLLVRCWALLRDRGPWRDQSTSGAAVVAGEVLAEDRAGPVPRCRGAEPP